MTVYYLFVSVTFDNSAINISVESAYDSKHQRYAANPAQPYCRACEALVQRIKGTSMLTA